jgi:outer membrane murein-binding lipoprotein Lpp
MYHPHIIQNDSRIDSNQQNVQKLRANIAELKDIMELAIREDNYALEDATRAKLRAMVTV